MEVFVARTNEDYEFAIARISKAKALGCDTETSGFNSKVGKLFSIQFSDGEFNVLLPLSEGAPLEPFAPILADDNVIKIFHNSKFDLEFLTSAGLQVRNVFDTMIAEKVLTRGANQSSSLAETLYRYFAVDLDKSQRAKFNRKWNGVWTDELIHYALSDVVHLPRLMREQVEWLEKLALENEFEMQMQKISLECRL